MEIKKESNIALTPQQIDDLARPLVGMVDRIRAYYDDPEHEREFQKWYDPAVQGLAAAVDQIIRGADPTIENLAVWGRIDQLPEQDLDDLAVEMNLLWYDQRASIEVKRQLIRDGYATWQAIGTKWAVENTVQTYFGDSNVEEWFQYGGRPGYFKVNINSFQMVYDNLDIHQLSPLMILYT